MSIFSLPDNNFAEAEWDLPPVQGVSASPWTASEAIEADPWQMRWTCKAPHVSIVGEANIRPWRAAIRKLEGRAHRFRLIAVEKAQRATVFVLVAAPVRGDLAIAGTMTLTGSTIAEKTSGATAYDSSVYSAATLAAPTTASFRPTRADKELAAGLRSGANGGDDEASLHHAFRLYGDATYRVMEAGSLVTVAAPYAANDQFAISHVEEAGDGIVRYYHNGTLVRTTPAVAVGTAFGFDSSFRSVNAKLASIGFGSAAAGARGFRIDAMPVSAEFLPEGCFLTIAFPSGEEQLLQLTADLDANSEGYGSASFTPPLREPIHAGIFPVHDLPWALMALDGSAPIHVSQGQRYDFTLSCSESVRAAA